jgi:hypothetical protein
MALPGTASAAARLYDGLGYALECVDTPVLCNEEPSDLALYPRGDQHSARFGKSLHPRRDVGGVAKNLACRVHHHWTRLEADTGAQRWFVLAGIPAVDFRQRTLDR